MIDDRLIQGIDLFNQKKFFEAHEVLEELWNDQPEPEKQLTQGLIQIAVGYHHLLRGNFVGAKKLLIKGFERLKPFCPQHEHLDFRELEDFVRRDLSYLQEPPEGWLPAPPQIRIFRDDRHTDV